MTTPTFGYEKNLWDQGYKLVVGIDEVGRGAWAGPVVVGAVAYSPDCLPIQGVRDSKELKAEVRERLSSVIQKVCVSFSFGIIGVEVINSIGIGKATQMAMRQAVRNLKFKPDFHLIDAFYIPHLNRQSQLPIIKGDKKSISIASASIIAKVFRDNLMKELSLRHPQYFFERNKGYGTKAHQAAIKKHGLSKTHRLSFDLRCLRDE